MAVRKRGSKWYGIYRENGKQIWVVLDKVETKREAQRALDKHLEHGLSSTNKNVRFSAFVKEWLELIKPEKSFNTYNGYSIVVNKHLIPYFGQAKIASIIPRQIDNFVTEKIKEGLKPKTINNMIIVLKLIFKRAIVDKIISESPAAHRKNLPVEKKELDYLKPDEIKAFLNATDSRSKTLFTVAVSTGLRISELLALRWSDIDYKSQTIYVRHQLLNGNLVKLKTASSKKPIKVASAVLNALKSQPRVINPDDLIFVSKNGTPLNRTNVVMRNFKAALRKAGLREVTFHSLRHSYNLMLLRSGANLRVVQEQMRHAYLSKTTLMDYGHALEEDTTAAAENVFGQVFASDKTIKENKDEIPA